MTENRPSGILWVVGAVCVVAISAAVGYSLHLERRGVRIEDWVIEIDMTAIERSACIVSIDGKVVEPKASGFEIYLDDSWVGTDRYRVTLDTLKTHGVELSTSRFENDEALEAVIRNEFDIPGDICDVGQLAEEDRSSLSLLPRNIDPRSEVQGVWSSSIGCARATCSTASY